VRNASSLAEEHLVSGVTQRALDAVASSLEPPAPGGLVVVACAEGDWHSLPAQMFAEMLRAHGFHVSFLGASTAAEDVSALIVRQRPDALAVSCSLPLSFIGVTRLVDAAHLHDTPALAGGRALGDGPDRAVRLGADAWAAGIDDAVAVLRRWQHERPPISAEPTAVDPTALQLDLNAPAIATAALEAMSASHPPRAAYGGDQLAQMKEELELVTRFTAAAQLVDDPTVLTDMLVWVRTLLANRAVPPAAVTAGLTALAPLVDVVDPVAGALLRDALEAVPDSGPVGRPAVQQA
jgi:methylmalonyl-CoA mutase cobalamin-binding subunit